MSIRCKMDGGKYYNRIQLGSFQHHSMAAALHVQFGPGWTTSILNNLGIHSTLCDEFTNSCKRKHEQDSARKISLKYKKQRMMTRDGQQTVKSLPDSSYGSNPAEPDMPCFGWWCFASWCNIEIRISGIAIYGVFDMPTGRKNSIIKNVDYHMYGNEKLAINFHWHYVHYVQHDLTVYLYLV